MAKSRPASKPDDQLMFSGFETQDPPSSAAPARRAARSAEPKSTPPSHPNVPPLQPAGVTLADDSPQGSRVREDAAARQQRHDAVGIASESLPEILRRAIAPSLDEPVPDLSGQLVVIIDSHSLIYQVFHALPPMTSTGGLPVAAVYGFVGDMLELIARKNPDYLIAAFDRGAITFRNDLYPEYKAHRESMPDELRQQIPLIRQIVDAMGIGIMEQAGFEADDLLATVAAKVQAAGGDCLVVTSDKDCRQLITPHTQIYNLRKDELIDAARLWELWGIRPDQVVDYQSLVGDPVDNVPGISLIGPKLAQSLLEQYDTLEGILDNADKMTGKKRKQNLMEGREQAMLSRSLVALRKDVDSPIPWSRSVRAAADLPRVDALLQEFGFRRLRTRAAELLGGIANGSDASEPSEAEWATDYRTITSEAELRDLANLLEGKQQIAIDTETTSTHARGCDLVGISIAWDVGAAAYIPIRAPLGDVTLDETLVIETLRPVLESDKIEKVGHNIKFDAIVLRSAAGKASTSNGTMHPHSGHPISGVVLGGIRTDTMIADYLLNPGRRNHTLDDLSRRRLDHTTTPIKDLIGTGKKQIRMDQVPVDVVAPYACEDVDVPLRISEISHHELAERGLEELYQTLEIPLVEVLIEMETNGIRVDAETLAEMSGRFEAEIADLQTIVFAAAGHSFNLDSPKQLAGVLFDELGLPVIKKTKTGISTDADVLSQLAVNHDIARHLLQYRQATKLKNTYIDTLPQLICEKTGRVHTSYRQDVAATGRLSSSEPNLQNIPIRTEQGKAIRGAFTASEPGWVLLGADYSQIELRVLAHYSGDEALLQAYRDDADIHTRVAAEVNGISEADVTSELRRIAKTINFGIVYGQSPFGLAKTLSIPKEEARDYIEQYFQRYSGVEQFMMETLARCRSEGYVSTMLGRRRELQGVRDLSKLPPEKRRSLTEVERIAINMPIQGTAADLIKLAMLRVHDQLKQSPLKARLLLQIHDELLLETPADEVEALTELVVEAMTSVMELDVPLKVDVASGPTWADC
ncbi:DNA polymerase I [Allorhodopirellula heiligendammensis]|uniref:DNA polymerase I n=1 Tax=Allorhodopirellula heiligendammensis TaxID=2714739 RepID=A0A5C6C0N2_9BACT|nr:DNA polymerase I [Allorhodopirellula heiligendammensis]TWU16714.1 DNA polymerase I [Allorhodopirellula heiligendammensis]